MLSGRARLVAEFPGGETPRRPLHSPFRLLLQSQAESLVWWLRRRVCCNI